MNVTIGIEKTTSQTDAVNLDISCCICNNQKLECKNEHTFGNDDLTTLLFDRKYGSVTWTNSNLQKTKIPLVTTLKYLSNYDLEYKDSLWNFKLKAHLQYNNIPKNSLILIDILSPPGVASCEGNINYKLNADATFSCSCNLGREAILSINKNKVLGSITWTGISDPSVRITPELNVDSITEVFFDEESQKWSFKMNLVSCDLPANSKVQIDILYQKRASTATCTLNSEKTFFMCTPDVENQTSEDKFRILFDKRIGSVTFANDESKIRFDGEADETEIEDSTEATEIENNPEENNDNNDNNDNKENGADTGDNADNKDNNNLTIIIIVCVVSALVIATVIFLVVYFIKKKRKNINEEIKDNKDNKEIDKNQKSDERIIKYDS